MLRDKKAKENLGTTGHNKPHNQANQGAAAAANANNRSDDNQVAIPKDLREVIEDSDDEYALFFEQPDKLLEIFSNLEEQNLFLIQQSQEIEQQYETKKHDYFLLEKELEREISILNKGLNEVEDKKNRLQQESKVMQNSAADEESKKIDP